MVAELFVSLNKQYFLTQINKPMKYNSIFPRQLKSLLFFASLIIVLQSCKEEKEDEENETSAKTEKPEYFNLRPETEKMFGYSHAVKIGNDIKISGAVSMDSAGNPTAVGEMAQQMKNCYADLDKVLKHYGYSFDDVIVENVFTTNMPKFLEVSGYRNEIYKKQFPTGSWLGVKELALPGFMIEIELEAHKDK